MERIWHIRGGEFVRLAPVTAVGSVLHWPGLRQTRPVPGRPHTAVCPAPAGAGPGRVL